MECGVSECACVGPTIIAKSTAVYGENIGNNGNYWFLCLYCVPLTTAQSSWKKLNQMLLKTVTTAKKSYKTVHGSVAMETSTQHQSQYSTLCMSIWTSQNSSTVGPSVVLSHIVVSVCKLPGSYSSTISSRLNLFIPCICAFTYLSSSIIFTADMSSSSHPCSVASAVVNHACEHIYWNRYWHRYHYSACGGRCYDQCGARSGLPQLQCSTRRE